MLALVLALLAGCGGSGSGKMSAPPPKGTPLRIQAAALLDRALRGEDAHCAPQGKGQAEANSSGSKMRFYCKLPSVEGTVTLQLVAAADGYAIKGCEHPSRRCVFDPTSGPRRGAPETPAEAHASSLLRQLQGVSDVSCSDVGGRLFKCAANFVDPWTASGVEVELSVEPRFFFIEGCRTTSLRIRTPFGCNHLTMDVDQMESTAKALSIEAARNR